INRIARLNSDGSLDTSFNIGTGFESTVIPITIQNDGKILVGGGFTNYNGTSINRIARLNSDGSLDTSFNIGTGFNAYSRSIVVQNDGKILVGGQFNSYNSTIVNRIARLNSDGSLDTSFNIGSGFNSTVFSIATQSDGKILVGGVFTNYNGTSINRIARLNSDGSLDTSFNIGTGFNAYPRSIVVQNDGKILVGGQFINYNSTIVNRIARLNSDGSLDTSFNTGTGFDTHVFSLSAQSDGKILAGGNFSNYNSIPTGYIARLNSDGSLDTTFNSGTGFNHTVYSLIIP
ncbi:MAG: delta-60 repeat domain-containing protein, partial [Candidatus Paceibacterota bacterium]